MKLDNEFESWTVAPGTMAAILGLSAGRISQLADEKIVIRDPSQGRAVFLVESLKNYYSSKKQYEKVNYWEERGLHERAKRKLTELKLRERRGELYSAAMVEIVTAEILTNFRNKISGLPAKLAAQLEGKARGEISEVLAVELDNLLKELSEALEAAEYAEAYEVEGDAEESD